MKKAARVLALFIVLCMALTMTALADDFETTVNVDGTDIVVTGDVDANGSITLATINGMDASEFPEDDEITQAIIAAALENVYDADAARAETFGIGGSDSDSASGESSGEVYDIYIDESASYDVYTFDGSTYGATEGNLTVTVGGVEVDPADLEGEYEDVVFTVTAQIPAFVDDIEENYRTALYVDADGVNEDLSVTAAIIEGEYDDEGASGLYINSQNDLFNGVTVVSGEYTIDGLTMIAEGNGEDDFAGYGVGIAVGGDARVTLNNYVYLAHGVIRYGMFIGGDDLDNPPELTVNDGIILTGNPEDEDGNYMYESNSNMSMSSSPWMLGIIATPEVRTQLIASTGISNYNNCVIVSSGWGIVSSDAVDSPAEWGEYTVQMNLTDCILDFTGYSGYVSYAIGATHNTFTDCIIGNAINSGVLDEVIESVKTDYDYDLEYESTVEIAEDGRAYNTTYALIVANETSGGTFDNVLYTGEYGVMYHKTNNVRYVPGDTDNTSDIYTDEDYAGGYTLIKDSTFYTNGAAILVKACTPAIYVENTEFIANDGVIVQLMTCDDPGMGSEYFSEVLDLTAEVEADPDYDPYDYNTKDLTVFDYAIEGMINDVQIEFAGCTGDTALNGDFYNSISVSTTGEGMTWWGQSLILSFDNCEINGAISSSSALHNAYSGYYDAEGNEVEADSIDEAIAAGAVEGRITSDNATYLGNLTNYTSPTVNNGVWVTLTNGSVWTPDDTCYITRLYVDETSAINGTVTIDGEAVELEAGVTYTGAIVVTPAEGEADASGEATAETAAAAGDTSEEAYHAYLKEYVAACPAVSDEQYLEFEALIDASDYTTMPADMMFDATWWGYAAMTYDEFVAAGGVYEIPEFDPSLTAD
ncbi:MAG: hypothetical protein LUE21_10990 [Oscillospiraceae bacterium]|nr:hypothetical protein [Oscillospiraceae bacterium]